MLQVRFDIASAEDAARAAAVCASIVASFGGEFPAVLPVSQQETRTTRRSNKTSATTSATAGAVTAAPGTAEATAQGPSEPVDLSAAAAADDPVAQYNALAAAAGTPTVADTAPANPTAPTRDEMFAALRKECAERGILWVRDAIINLYKVTELKALTDEQMTAILATLK